MLIFFWFSSVLKRTLKRLAQVRCLYYQSFRSFILNITFFVRLRNHVYRESPVVDLTNMLLLSKSVLFSSEAFTMHIVSLFIISCFALKLILAASRPECFPTSPACLRPQVSECREALMLMRHTDPGFVTLFGRHLPWKRHTIDVPRIWQSSPRNCVVKLDVIAPEATDSFRLQYLTAQGEEVISACITGGTKCGGIINVGPKMVMQLQLGYYSAITPYHRTTGPPANISLLRPAAALNRSIVDDDLTAASPAREQRRGRSRA